MTSTSPLLEEWDKALAQAFDGEFDLNAAVTMSNLLRDGTLVEEHEDHIVDALLGRIDVNAGAITGSISICHSTLMRYVTNRPLHPGNVKKVADFLTQVTPVGRYFFTMTLSPFDRSEQPCDELFLELVQREPQIAVQALEGNNNLGSIPVSPDLPAVLYAQRLDDADVQEALVSIAAGSAVSIGDLKDLAGDWSGTLAELVQAVMLTQR